MSGYPADNHPAFHTWAKLLRAEGFDVINPAELDEELGKTNYTSLLARDLPYVARCDGGAAMHGWRGSNGGRWEAAILCHMLKRPVFELPRNPQDFTDMRILRPTEIPCLDIAKALRT